MTARLRVSRTESGGAWPEFSGVYVEHRNPAITTPSRSSQSSMSSWRNSSSHRVKSPGLRGAESGPDILSERPTFAFELMFPKSNFNPSNVQLWFYRSFYMMYTFLM